MGVQKYQIYYILSIEHDMYLTSEHSKREISLWYFRALFIFSVYSVVYKAQSFQTK